MEALTDKEMELWDRIGDLTTNVKESVWESGYIADSLNENVEVVKEVMEKMEYWQYTEDRIGKMLDCPGSCWGTKRIAFVLGEDEDYTEAVIAGMEEQGMVANAVKKNRLHYKMWYGTDAEVVDKIE